MKSTFSQRNYGTHASTSDKTPGQKEQQTEAAFFAQKQKSLFFQQPIKVNRQCDQCNAGDKHEHNSAKPLIVKPVIADRRKAVEEEIPVKRKQDLVVREEKLNRSAADDKEKKVRRKQQAVHAGEPLNSGIPPMVAGEKLSSDSLVFFKRKMGVDFSQVRIHTGTPHAISAKKLNAHAYTVGNNLVFSQAAYNPGTFEGKKLLAHELMHVAQHNNKSAVVLSAVDRKPDFANSGIVQTGATGKSTITKNTRCFGCEGLSIQAHTDANYSNSFTSKGTAKPSQKCSDCTGDCISETGTIISTFQANPAVTLPGVPAGLSNCESVAVSKFINTTLTKHEKKHVAAFNKYNGIIKTPYKFVGCKSDLDLHLQSIHNGINAKRTAKADALSAALDPFNPPIPCKCD